MWVKWANLFKKKRMREYIECFESAIEIEEGKCYVIQTDHILSMEQKVAMQDELKFVRDQYSVNFIVLDGGMRIATETEYYKEEPAE